MLSRASVGLLLTLLSCSASAQKSCDNNDLKVSYPAPEAADGWTYRLVIEELTDPRGLLFDDEGGLVVVQKGVGLVHFSLEDEGGTCVSVGEKTTLVENEDLNHGIALSDDGRTLYASTDDDVFSWPYDASDPGELSSDDRRTLVTNMTNDGHVTRTLLLSKKEPGILLVSRGSDGNEDEGAADLDSGRSQIRSFNLTALDEGDDPYDYLDGDVWGWGLRNSVGVAEDPVHGGIWSVENSVDMLERNGKDVHKDNPGEELNFHGFINGSADGDILKETGEENNYGYPLCYAIWGTENFPDLGDLETGDQFPDEESSDATDESCNEDFISPRLSFQAHTAPLDILFSEDGSEAYISFHGSWNREEPVGYNIAKVDFKDGMPTAPHGSRSAAKPILSTPDLDNCPDDCFRPVGLAWDSKERLWFTSDSTGEVFVMERSGSGGGGNGEEGGDDGDQDEDAGVRLGYSKLAVAVGAIAMGLLLA